MWQQRTSTSASMLREIIAMSSFVGTNPETCISRQFSEFSLPLPLSLCLSQNSTNHYLRTSFVSVLKQSINQTIEQIKHTLHVSAKVQERVWLPLTMAHIWQIIGQSIPIYIPLTPLDCDPPLVSIRLLSLVSSFRVSSAQMRLVECAQIKVNELFLTSCFPLSLLVISSTPLSPTHHLLLPCYSIFV